MRRFWMKATTIGFALGVLAMLMVQAGLSSGCGASKPTPETQSAEPEPALTTKAGAAEPTAAPTETAAAEPAPAPSASESAPASPHYLPATKSGGFFPKSNPAPVQQQQTP